MSRPSASLKKRGVMSDPIDDAVTRIMSGEKTIVDEAKDAADAIGMFYRICILFGMKADHAFVLTLRWMDMSVDIETEGFDETIMNNTGEMNDQ